MTCQLGAHARAYAESFARTVIGDANLSVPPDLLVTIWSALARDEELATPQRDEWGNWEYAFGSRDHGATPKSPWLDSLILAHAAQEQAASGISQVHPPWPDGHPFALCITHDVDGVSAQGHHRRFFRRLGRAFVAEGPRRVPALQAAGSLYRLITGALGADAIGRFETWLDIEAQFGFHSTWFFLPSEYARVHAYDMDYRHGDMVVFRGERMSVSHLMRSIAALGHEIGLHGSYLSSNDAALLSSQRQQVEHAAGVSITSVRQHFLRYDAAASPTLHENAGFRCDSTQGFNMTPGFRAGTSFPYWAWNAADDRPSRVLEIPLHVMDSTLFGVQRLSRDAAVRATVDVMDAVEAVGGCLTINWHPNYVADERYVRSFESVLAEAARRNAWGCSCQELLSWWTAREALVGASANVQHAE